MQREGGFLNFYKDRKHHVSAERRLVCIPENVVRVGDADFAQVTHAQRTARFAMALTSIAEIFPTVTMVGSMQDVAKAIVPAAVGGGYTRPVER